ncbi:Vacuolar protein sorting 46a [Giardia duodenalis]|uniref:Vacuolar protein sorting 46a n=2 Tax=Giardia intestinalis TaxID=5741 RepID=A8B7L4_GIAIC|nr:Vacuolar protein sorting 46a [Giardia intestinalis]KAE8305433.1 Vacuolar protein sorting 46a [Giardia intestinalis]|eukprot:XP_001708833.1 Hypothetical protein GL50803_15472 [Giardia lamblia ATCC 50803]
MGKIDLTDQAIELKIAGKQMESQARRLETDVKNLRLELQRVIASNNRELANTKANLLVAKQNQINQLYKLAGQMEIIATQLEIGGLMMENAKEIKGLNKNVKKALNTMDTKALAKIMDEFAKSDKNLSMNTAFMGQMMGEQTSATMDSQVAAKLIAEVALEQKLTLPSSFADLVEPAEAQVAQSVE